MTKLSPKQKRERRLRRMEQRHRRGDRDLVGNYRTVHLRAKTIDEDDRSVEVTLATDEPVLEYDWETYRAIPHYLDIGGMEVPSSRQVPMLDSHERHSVQNTLGSIRSLRKDVESSPQEVIGRAMFSSLAEDEWTKVREGHLTDVSVGYRAIATLRIKDGETETYKGREIVGPAIVVTKSRAFEGSLVPIGADEQAKMRGIDPSKIPLAKERFKMDEKLRQLLEKRGMPVDLSDGDAQAWLIDNQDRALAPIATPVDPPVVPATDPPGQRKENDATALTPDSVRQMVADALVAADKERARHIEEVSALITLVDGDDNLRADCVAMTDMVKVREACADFKAHRRQAHSIPGEPQIEFGAAEIDKFRSAVGTSLNLRCLQDAGGTEDSMEKVFPVEKRAKDAGQFHNYSLFGLAEECLVMDGVPRNQLRGAPREDIALAALGFWEQSNLRAEGHMALHTTGSFTLLTQDAINKSMQIGYTEAPSTWRGPMREGAPASDFKDIHRMRLGAVPNLPIWPDNTDPDVASFKDSEEKYAVECRSVQVDFSYRLLINDDINALSRVPSQLGDAASRTVNSVAWAEITANALTEDGVALFAAATGNRNRTNLTTGAGPPSVTTIQTLTNLMMQMRGENDPAENESDDVLALMPQYIVGPSAMRSTVLQEVRSIADPAGNHAGIANLSNNLIPVIEPLLDADSTTAWYLFASTARIDTVEVTFLQGQQTPVVRTFTDNKTLSQSSIVLQTFAAKALNHRGMQKHDGV